MPSFLLILDVSKVAVLGSFDFQVRSFPLDFIYLKWLHSTRIFLVYSLQVEKNQPNIQSLSSIMIFELSFFLSLALALSSLDAVTAIFVPRSVDGEQLNRRYSGAELTFYTQEGVA